MFKRLFFLSDLVAFVLACALMYFWYLPGHPTQEPTSTRTESGTEVIPATSDSLEVIVPQE